MFVAKKDEAVSPVIGTILLVAITVVLVAIVAAVVMGMVGGIGDSKNVGVRVVPATEEGAIFVTVSSGSDANKIAELVAYAGAEKLTWEKGTDTTVVVGKPYKFTGITSEGANTISVTGVFTDNTSQVLYTGTIGISATATTAQSPSPSPSEQSS